MAGAAKAKKDEPRRGLGFLELCVLEWNIESRQGWNDQEFLSCKTEDILKNKTMKFVKERLNLQPRSNQGTT